MSNRVGSEFRVPGLRCARARNRARRTRYAPLTSSVSLLLLSLLIIGALLPQSADAQRTGEVPAEFSEAGVEEKLGETIPGDIVFRNEDGEEVALDDYFDGDRPVLLNLVYYDCPMLCGLVVQGLTKAMARMPWVPGQEFDVLTVSFNAAEGPEMATAAKAHALQMLGKPRAADGWHFLTGSHASIERLTDAVGFQFQWVEDQQEFVHPSVLMFVSGDRTLSRYIYGIEYDARDVRTALVEASNGNVGSTVDRVLLYCFQYDPDKNSYVPHAFNLMKLGGLLTMISLGTMLFVFWRRESRRSRDAAVA